MSERRDRFDALYAGNIDPWNFTTSAYERDKYQATLAALPRARYQSALEVGCSIGELTRLLSDRCDRLLAVDVSEVALAEARRRNADRSTIAYVRGELPQDWPEGEFDLIVVSEVLYFLTRREIVELAGRVGRALTPGGDCVVVNYAGLIEDGLQGEAAAGIFADQCRAMGCSVMRLPTPKQYRLALIRKGA